jgi:spore coat polysaccharide biosynthesis protein SpsF
MKSKLITDIVLAISENPGNEAFIEFAKKHNLKYVTGDDTDVLKRLIDGAKYVNADVIFRITSENPYIYWEGIDNIIKKHEEKKFDFTYVDGLPLGSYFEIISLKALETSHRMGSKKHRSELATLYIKENKKKFKINQIMPEKELQRPEVRLTVDSPEDLWVAREIQNAFRNTGRPIPLKQVIKFLDKHPEIARVNSQVPLGVSRIWY